MANKPNFMEDFEVELGPSVVTPVKDPLKRKDLFTKGSDVYLLDSFKGKSNQKIAAFRLRVNAAIMQAYKTALDHKDDLVPLDWEPAPNSEKPKLTFHVNCPDEFIDERMQDVIETLYNVARNGMIIEVKNIGAKDSKWATLLEEIMKAAQMPELENNPFKTQKNDPYPKDKELQILMMRLSDSLNK